MEKKMLNNQQKREYLHKILDLALDVNGLEARQQEETGNLPTVFFFFHGQCGSVSVDVHEEGWFPNYGDHYTSELHLEQGSIIESNEQVYKDTVSYLETLKEKMEEEK